MVALSELAGARTRRQLRPIRVMLVDDSLTVRSAFSRRIANEPDLEVVGKFSSAELAIAGAHDINPDVILLDLEMPGMGGMKALPILLTQLPGVQVLVVSSYTQEGTEQTLNALAIGAADTMPKPRTGQSFENYCEQLLTNIRALGLRRVLRNSGRLPASPRVTHRKPAKDAEAIAIGASTGGIHALCSLIRALPSSFNLPMLVTQHLPESFMPVFARQLKTATSRKVSIPVNGTIVRHGEIYIAPGDGHLTVEQVNGRLSIAISGEHSRSGCRPSVDPMLKSLGTATQGKAVGIILSGMGSDGLYGAESLVLSGGTIYAQDEQSSAVWGMPQAVAVNGLASAILPPAEIARQIGRIDCPRQ